MGDMSSTITSTTSTASTRDAASIKFVQDGIVEKTIDRDSIWMAQTPQAFQKDKLYGFHQELMLNLTQKLLIQLLQFFGYSLIIHKILNL